MKYMVKYVTSKRSRYGVYRIIEADSSENAVAIARDMMNAENPGRKLQFILFSVEAIKNEKP